MANTFSQIYLQMIFKMTLKFLNFFEICVLYAKDTNINIWETLKIAQNVIYFLQMLVNGLVKTSV